MPSVSKAQNRFMWAHAKDKGKLGKVAREFTSAQEPGSVKKLPERVGEDKPKSKGWYSKNG
jgi:hypothetical protein